MARFLFLYRESTVRGVIQADEYDAAEAIAREWPGYLAIEIRASAGYA